MRISMIGILLISGCALYSDDDSPPMDYESPCVGEFTIVYECPADLSIEIDFSVTTAASAPTALNHIIVAEDPAITGTAYSLSQGSCQVDIYHAESRGACELLRHGQIRLDGEETLGYAGTVEESCPEQDLLHGCEVIAWRR